MDVAGTARAALMAGRVVVGGGTLVAPRRMGAVFGVEAEHNPAVSYVGRLFGVRALLQVALLGTAGSDDRARQLRWGVAVDLVDAAAAAAAGRDGDLSRRAAALAGAAALAEAGLGCLALAADRPHCR
ncbi:MAG: hypothetical protein WCD35_08125 [Mycobacteriales bacterium]